MPRRFLTGFLLVSAFYWTIAAADSELERRLTNRYRNQVFILRHSLEAGSQHYDFGGKPISAANEGPWTLYGRVAVKKIIVGSDELRVEGHRVIYMLIQKKDA